MGTEEVDTRSEQLDEGMFEVQNASQNLETLVKYHGLESDRVDLWDLRARIHVAEEHLKAAKKLVDRELGKDAHHERRGDLVIVATNTIKDSETYRGGDSMPLRVEVASVLAEKICGDSVRLATGDGEVEFDDDISAEQTFAVEIADGLAKVWSQPAKSKLPSKPALKKLGLDPEEWFTSETVAKLKVTVMELPLYESIFGEGSAPKAPISEIQMAQEPF